MIKKLLFLAGNRINGRDLPSYLKQAENWTKYKRQHWTTGRTGLWLQEEKRKRSSSSHLSFLPGGHFWTTEQGRGIQIEQRGIWEDHSRVRWGDRGVSMGYLWTAGICRAQYHRGESYLKVQFQESVLGALDCTSECEHCVLTGWNYTKPEK